MGHQPVSAGGAEAESPGSDSRPFGDDIPVFVISVAAHLSGLHPQALRTYDRMGLVCPVRTAGRARRYSMRDIVMLREIQRLSQEEGVNLAGIKQILELQRETAWLHDELARLTALVEELTDELESTRAVAARLAQQGRRASRETAR
ncbi:MULTISPECIES: helix-turn-helix transcriptional regulator [unclassified Actinomadura]|uniref:heat shock protein transcriptional repressor HspR n=1 Tax=Actinomadura sp. NPDC000600 TaxID=3154262 RepID=UPI0011ECC249|nr:helix-turn-helix transcriptional regulator [Actinomadura sp. K4S16]